MHETRFPHRFSSLNIGRNKSGRETLRVTISADLSSTWYTLSSDRGGNDETNTVYKRRISIKIWSNNGEHYCSHKKKRMRRNCSIFYSRIILILARIICKKHFESWLEPWSIKAGNVETLGRGWESRGSFVWPGFKSCNLAARGLLNRSSSSNRGPRRRRTSTRN